MLLLPLVWWIVSSSGNHPPSSQFFTMKIKICVWFEVLLENFEIIINKKKCDSLEHSSDSLSKFVFLMGLFGFISGSTFILCCCLKLYWRNRKKGDNTYKLLINWQCLKNHQLITRLVLLEFPISWMESNN